MAVAAALILLELGGTAAGAYGVLLLFSLVTGQLPTTVLPLALRLGGLGLIALGSGVGALTFRLRPPREMLISTSFTLEKLFFRRPLEAAAGRQEPFVAAGPYRYVRNPLYLGVLAVVLGLGIALSSILLLLWTAVLLGWYWFVLIPFEEKELGALFGESYETYLEHVPRILPYKPGYDEPSKR